MNPDSKSIFPRFKSWLCHLLISGVLDSYFVYIPKSTMEIAIVYTLQVVRILDLVDIKHLEQYLYIIIALILLLIQIRYSGHYYILFTVNVTCQSFLFTFIFGMHDFMFSEILISDPFICTFTIEFTYWQVGFY